MNENESFKYVFIAMKGDTKIIYKTYYFSDILFNIFENKNLKEDYFKVLKQRAINHILSPNNYEIRMLKNTMNINSVDKSEILNEEMIYKFECWIEDEYSNDDIISIIKKYGKFDYFNIFKRNKLIV